LVTITANADGTAKYQASAHASGIIKNLAPSVAVCLGCPSLAKDADDVGQASNGKHGSAEHAAGGITKEEDMYYLGLSLSMNVPFFLRM